jgi:hypothetical protein
MRMQGKGTLTHCPWDCKLVQPLWKSTEVSQISENSEGQWLLPVILVIEKQNLGGLTLKANQLVRLHLNQLKTGSSGVFLSSWLLGKSKQEDQGPGCPRHE